MMKTTAVAGLAVLMSLVLAVCMVPLSDAADQTNLPTEIKVGGTSINIENGGTIDMGGGLSHTIPPVTRSH